ncbi:MAG: molybdenum ABC transporter ATP-binding protein [Gammaproteobacteria bacterium]|nr:molybdenum ABC transporter ATP-binding protein [Gammaproteobacteria bacterium]MBT4491627.1 molybdenum ABC transporter ATP-binding protein [Gammaproteobacteria bacterium]
MSLELRVALERDSGFEVNVDITIATDRVTALFGSSGSGKSTLLRLITGLERADNVVVRFNGETWQDENNFVPPHQRCTGYVFQHLNLFPHLTAAGNLEFAEKRRHKNSSLSRQDVVEMLDIANLLQKRPDQLSGGEQQRVAIARALLSNPRLLIMDEPLGSIDTAARTRILPYLQRLHDTLKIPVIYVSHALDEVLEFADTVISIESGKVISEAPIFDFAIDGPGAEQPTSAAIIRCVVESQDHDHALATVSFEGQTMYLAAEHYRPGDMIRIKIPARDVSLTREKPRSSSILNILESTIAEINDPGLGPTAVVKVACGEQRLLARITRKSLIELNLKPGDIVFTQIKGVALITDHER